MTSRQVSSSSRGVKGNDHPEYRSVYQTLDGEHITIRPMVPSDKDALLQFFRNVPPEERMFLNADVASSDVVARWAKTLEDRRVLPLLALVDDRIVGDATLHRDIDPVSRHTGAVRIVIDRAYRNKGLGRFLLKRLITIAKNDDGDLEKIVFEIVPDVEPAAQHVARALGFAPVDDLSQYVHHYGGTPRNVMLMELRVRDTNVKEEEEDPAQYMF